TGLLRACPKRGLPCEEAKTSGRAFRRAWMYRSLLPPGFKRIALAGLLCGALLFADRVAAQTASSSAQDQSSKSDKTEQPAQASAPSDNQQEVSSRDTPATFKVRVNNVLVRVVVRDAKGQIVPGLKKDDFQLYDGKKPQTISSFTVETPQSHTASALSSSAGEASSSSADAIAGKAAILPQRFVSMLFDDVHLSMEDTVFVRDKATKFFGALAPSDRVAINTTSGQLTQDYTSDHALLEKALLQVLPRPLTAHSSFDCPDMTYYEADLIANRNDVQAIAVAQQETLQCAFNGSTDPRAASAALAQAQAAAYRALADGDNETEFAYRHLQAAIQRMTSLPGQRVLVFVSPGFILSTLQAEASDMVDRATRANVVINTIDARGLYAPDVMGDLADPPRDTFRTTGFKSLYRVSAQMAQEDVLAQLADGTGGTFYHNRNDVDEAMRQAGAAPAVSYLLSFSPQNLKLDGRFHALKVSLTSKQKYTLQARHGYFAPRANADPEQATKEEIQEALFSQEEIHDLPVDLQTQYFKKDEADARLAVLTHLDVKAMRFRKALDRNNDRLTIVTGIFDENGQFVTGLEKIVDMKLRDTTYDRLSRSGFTVKTSFDVKPGTYLVRLVVRDSEGAQMAARNGAVVIPY
ncbi:MAG TPA: VWA domain-containing protein, partial [Candidatus Acidoferrum sp.]|nr:VWA domain-containing protein [Candidatus Acidoferrum sp.]